MRRDGGGAIDGALRFELVRALAAADRANNAVLQERDGRWTVQGDPTEGALIVAARKAGLEARGARRPVRAHRGGAVLLRAQADEHGSQRRRAGRSACSLLTKGAPDVLLARCSHELVGEEARASDGGTPRGDPADQRGARRRGAAHARGRLPLAAEGRAQRARTFDERVEQDLVFLGLIGMIDPPRDEARDAVARAKGAGIRPMMITGDHPRTAAVIAAELGIAADGRAVTGAELEKHAGGDARPDGPGGVGLCARQSRAQAADRQGAAARRDDGRDDRRRRQRRARAEDRRHRRRHGHHRDRRLQGSGRHGARRRQLRHRSSRRSKRGARSSRTSGSSCATCCRRTSAR